MQQRIVNQRLLASARRADPEAIEALYHAFSESLYLTALRITRSHQDAEDVLHDLFVGLPQKLSTFESRGNFEGWLRKVAVRTALMVVRRRSRTLPPPPPAVRRTRTEERMITQLDLAAALEQLPQTYREVFVLKAIEGYSHSEIAETLGITESNSMVRLHRARSTLRDLLEGAR